MPVDQTYVEVDESLFAHENGSQKWVVGLYERTTREFRCFVVENGNTPTLNVIMQGNIKKGAHIVTNFWRGYNKLKDIRYKHTASIKTINGHSTGDATTSHIEGEWGIMKRIRTTIYNNHIPGSSLNEFIDELVARRNCEIKKLSMEKQLIEIVHTYGDSVEIKSKEDEIKTQASENKEEAEIDKKEKKAEKDKRAKSKDN